MKKMLSLAAMFAALSYASPVFADTDITVYGTLDAAFGDVAHSLSINPQLSQSVNPVSPQKLSVPGAAVGLFNGGLSDSRIGVKGKSDIGSGLKVFWNLEEGFNLPTGQVNNGAAALASNAGTATTAYTSGGSLSGQLFSRQANVGLSNGDWGSLAIGRNTAPINDICQVYGPVQNAVLFSPLGFSGTYGGGGGVTEDARVDNSLKYSNKIGSFNFRALYKLGGTAGEATARAAYALNAGYEEGNFGIQIAYQAFTDAISGSLATTSTIPASLNKVVPSNSVTITAENTSAFMAAVKYKIGQATLKVGYEQYILSAPTDALPSNTTANTATYNYYGQTVSGLINFKGAPQSVHVVFGGGDYNFTDKLNVAAGIYDISPQASAGTTVKSENEIFLSLLADYHITKFLDTYAGVMYASFSGSNASFAPSTYYQDNVVSAVGLRYTF
jgi:GBP family porin